MSRWKCSNCQDFECALDINEIRRHIHWHRMGTTATEDECPSCQKMAERHIEIAGMEGMMKLSKTYDVMNGIYTTNDKVSTDDITAEVTRLEERNEMLRNADELIDYINRQYAPIAQLEAENDALREWRAKAFEAHPNIDLDIARLKRIAHDVLMENSKEE